MPIRSACTCVCQPCHLVLTQELGVEKVNLSSPPPPPGEVTIGLSGRTNWCYVSGQHWSPQEEQVSGPAVLFLLSRTDVAEMARSLCKMDSSAMM